MIVLILTLNSNGINRGIGNNYFLRSTYELEYAKKLDIAQIKYLTENIRLKYFDTTKRKYRIAVPDFYLPESNTLVEIKSTYWYDEQNMKDKFSAYKENGFNYKLILDFNEITLS